MMLRSVALSWWLVVSVFPSVGRAQDGVIDPEDWLILTDFAPFVHSAKPIVRIGGGRGRRFFEGAPDALMASTQYVDQAHLARVSATITREVRVAYLLHWLEGDFVSHRDGALSRESSVVSVLGSRVFYRCEDPPNCSSRSYQWRSGVDLHVSVTGGTYMGDEEFTPGAPPTPAPCPEFPEILHAYLQRYPSSLPEYPSEEERASRWRREDVALTLAGAKYRIGMAERKGTEQLLKRDVREVSDRLVEFLEKREEMLKGPSAEREVAKVVAYHELSPREELPKLKAAAAGYEAWWNQQGYGPLDVPPLPAP